MRRTLRSRYVAHEGWAKSSGLSTAHAPLACLHQIALESANKTIETLRHELSSMDVHSSMKERLDLQARVSKLEGQLAQEEAKVAASAQEAASLRKHGAGLQRRIDELQGQIGELNGTIADLRRSMGGVVRIVARMCSLKDMHRANGDGMCRCVRVWEQSQTASVRVKKLQRVRSSVATLRRQLQDTARASHADLVAFKAEVRAMP